jgi:hypothetical protein
MVSALALLICENVAAQVTSTQPPNPNITLPGPQAHQPQVGRQQVPPGTRAPQPINQTLANGTIEGFVYWDASQFSHNPASSCSGLAITVSAGSSSGPFTSYTPIGTLSNNFKYVGQVRGLLSGVKATTYDVCTYGFDHVPVGQNLQVSLTVTQPTSFSPAAVPQYGTVGPIQIINGQCNMLPRITNPTVSDLTGHWGTCQDMAYGVNFDMHVAPRGGLITVVSGEAQSGGTKRGLLGNSNPSSGMLLSASPQTQTTNSQPATRGLLLPAKPGAGGTVQLNPQPLPPGPTGSPAASTGNLKSARAIPRVLSAPQQGQKITNPKAGLQDSAIIAVLRKQSAAATAEAAQMKLSIRPAGFQPQPSTLMSASGSGGMLRPASTAQPVASTAIVPATPGSSNRYGTMSPGMIPGTALQCGRDPAMRILTVNGGPNAAVFTQDATNNFNFYTITGCSFGNPGPNAKAYIYYQGTFHENLEIQQWSENFIALNVDPNLAGVDDQSNVTLVIQRDDGQQATKGGYKFYAARNTVLLPQIPKKDFSLDQFRPDQSVIQSWKPTYTSASSGSVTPNLPDLSAEVHWDIATDANGSVLGGKDNYDFSAIHSTFVLDSAVLEWRSLSCTDPNYNQFKTSSDNWGIDWSGNSGLQVNWQGQVCQPTPGSCGGGGIFQTDCFVNSPESNYGVDVWVTGPRGLDPWTGKPLS